MQNSRMNIADGPRPWFSSLLVGFMQSGMDPRQAEPRLLRQVRVLNGLMLIATLLCIPLGALWVGLADTSFGYVYGVAFVSWAGLICWLRFSLRVVAVGRAAVFVLFSLCTASIIMLGGTQSNLLAWYMLMPLAGAVCVGRRDLWFWGFVATLTPILLHLFPEFSAVNSSPLSAEASYQLSGIVLALGALVVSILTGIWISHHERLATKLDDSVERLQKEAESHRLLVDIAMLASAEIELTSGARKMLEQLSRMDWVSAVCFWDARISLAPSEPYCTVPSSAVFLPSPLLGRSLRTGARSVSKVTESNRRSVFYPIQDGQTVVGVIEVDVGEAHESLQDGSWLIQQIAIQLGHIAERERTAHIIQREAQCDSLTNLHNRRAFLKILESEIAAAQQTGERMALLFIDLNDFKRVNDSLGHAAGDSVLQVVAKRLQNAVRKKSVSVGQASRAQDSLSRVGGDEFTLILDAVESAEDAERAAQRIIDSLSAPIRIDHQEFKVGASIGIALYPEDAQLAEVLVRSADAAMYAAKRRGGSGYSRYRDADRAVDSLGFEAEMRQALADGQLEMHYQPIYQGDSGELVGAEALIRWHHPSRGWVPPSEFIPLAESIGLIAEIGKFQFDSVFRWYSSARGSLPRDFRIALNLSPNQIGDPTFAGWLLKRLASSKIPMRNIELEITETALLIDTPEVQANVRAFADLGLCITLDDFGTGQSSLSLLKRFPIGRIKIDQSFVSGLPDRSEDVAIVGAVLSLARALNIPVVAEGVEQEAQRVFLAHRQCDELQGYLLARPMTGAKLIDTIVALGATAGDVEEAAVITTQALVGD